MHIFTNSKYSVDVQQVRKPTVNLTTILEISSIKITMQIKWVLYTAGESTCYSYYKRLQFRD